MRRLVTVSFTALDAGGGVPKFNRDLHAAFPDRECVHFCWDEFFGGTSISHQTCSTPEWEKARLLNHWLVARKHVGPDDVIVADGFWADGLQHLPYVISHSHGIWSHLTVEDAAAGKQPDMPFHHAAQVAFRQRWTKLGKPLTAVSDFIANQMRLQWGFPSTVINNGVDTDFYRPKEYETSYCGDGPIVIHGVNDRSNANKGWDHIELLIQQLGTPHVMSYDEAYDMFCLFSDRPWEKHEVLAQAAVVVHPSGFEGNSMFVAEALASGVPVLGYDVGYLWKAAAELGSVIDRTRRSPKYTLEATRYLLDNMPMMEHLGGGFGKCRELAVRDLSIRTFRKNWRAYVERLEAA